MGDFPERWEWVRDLPGGAQGHTFVVRRSDKSDSKDYVLKRLINPKRQEYFNREIEACMTLDHPNVLKVLEHGRTPKDRPFLITEYCAGLSLEHGIKFDNPGAGLRFFRQIVAGVAHAHAHEPQICHLDLKPANVLLRDGMPVVGDFGICFIDGEDVNLTSEGQRGSRYYCAPGTQRPENQGGTPGWRRQTSIPSVRFSTGSSQERCMTDMKKIMETIQLGGWRTCSRPSRNLLSSTN